MNDLAELERALEDLARRDGHAAPAGFAGAILAKTGLSDAYATLASPIGPLLVAWGRDGITANIVLPGRIATPRITFLDEQKAKREGRSVAEVSSESVASIPVGRYGDPKEYAAVVTFLASVHAAYVTGSVVRIDGGLITSV